MEASYNNYNDYSNDGNRVKINNHSNTDTKVNINLFNEKR